jgi:hypothetical protein
VSGGLERRLVALAEAVEVASGRLDPGVVEEARRVSERGGRRVGLGLEATVVALAGPTGAGKSTLFNAFAGAELSAAGARRPTTDASAAAVWGNADEGLLDWLEVPRRHRIADGKADGLVLLDLPDFDSVAASHRREFERVLDLVDLVVWVVDPQKYADSALHDRYLVPLARHSETTIVVLNQSDLLDARALAACCADLRRLLERDGLDGVPVVPVSARSSDGMPELRQLVERRVAARKAALQRLAADVGAAAAGMEGACGGGHPRIGRADRSRLAAALADAAGLPVVVQAVAGAHRRRGALATGWPFVRWLRRLRPDPLRRLRLGDEPAAEVHTSLPGPTPVHRAQVFEAARALAAGASDGLAAPWPRLARDAATSREDELGQRLDRAVAGADLKMRKPRWWGLAGLLQTILAVVVAAGVLWLLVLVGLGFLHLDDAVRLPELGDVPLPTLLLIGGALAGILLAALFRAMNAAGARRRARRASSAIQSRVEAVADEAVVAPVEAELAARERLCAALRAAAGRPGRRR